MQLVFQHAFQNNLVKNTKTDPDIPLSTRVMKNTWQELRVEQMGEKGPSDLVFTSGPRFMHVHKERKNSLICFRNTLCLGGTQHVSSCLSLFP